MAKHYQQLATVEKEEERDGTVDPEIYGYLLILVIFLFSLLPVCYANCIILKTHRSLILHFKL